MVLRIDTRASRELQAILLAVKRAPKDIQAQIRKQTKAIGEPQFRSVMTQNSQSRLELRVLRDTARVTASNQNVRLSSATIGRPLRGGLKPKIHYPAIEFGSYQEKPRTYEATSTRGRKFKVTRVTTAQLRPKNPTGYVFYPAVAEMIPRIAALWAQTVVRTFAGALEGKSNG